MTFDRSKLFSSKATTERTIKIEGEEYAVHVRRLPALDLRKFHAEVLSDSIDTRAEAGFEAIAKACRNEDGSEFASVGELRRFKPEAVKALMEVFTEVNTSKSDDDLGNG